MLPSKMPSNRVVPAKHIEDTIIGEVYYTTVSAVVVDSGREAWLNPEVSCFTIKDETTPITLTRVSDLEFHVSIDMECTFMWTPRSIRGMRLYPITDLKIAN